MKIKIRNGVFETNSSSTHSLTIKTTKKYKREKTFTEEYIEELETKIKELENLQNLDDMQKYELEELKRKLESEKRVSFSIKSPFAKVVWFLGMVDNAEGKKGKTVFEEETHDLTTDRGIVRNFKDLLISKYCELENISKDEAIERFVEENSKYIQYETIYKNPQHNDVNNLVSTVKENGKINTEKLTELLSKREAMQSGYVTKTSKRKCDKCTRFECDHYFAEGCLDDCTCGFEYYSDIAYELETFKANMSWEEFAGEFLTDAYFIDCQEDITGLSDCNICY